MYMRKCCKICAFWQVHVHSKSATNNNVAVQKKIYYKR